VTFLPIDSGWRLRGRHAGLEGRRRFRSDDAHSSDKLRPVIERDGEDYGQPLGNLNRRAGVVGYLLLLTANEMVLALRKPAAPDRQRPGDFRPLPLTGPQSTWPASRLC
jgi:hypothetical protein